MSNTFTNADVVTIATRQKRLVWLILASLTIVPIVASFAPGALVLAGLVNIALVYDLAKALKCGDPRTWCIGMLIPIISLILMLVLSAKATKAIRDKGVKVGLLGASKSELAKLTATA